MDLESEVYQSSEQRIRQKNRTLSCMKIQDQLSKSKSKPKLIKGFSKHSANEKNDRYLERISQSQSSEGDPSAECRDVNSFLDSSISSSSENSSQSFKSKLSKSVHRKVKSHNSIHLPELNHDMQEIIDQYQFVVEQAQVQFNCQPNKELKKLIVDKLVEKHIDNQSVEDDNYNNSKPYHSRSAVDHNSHQCIEKFSQDQQMEYSEDQIKIMNENEDQGSTKTKPFPKLSYQELQRYFDLIQNTTFQNKFKKSNKVIDSKLDQSITSSSQSSAFSNQSKYHHAANRHTRLIQRNAEQDQYSIRLTRLRGLNKYRYIYENYTDEYALLAFRQIFYLIVSFMKTSIKIFMKSLYYQIFLTLVLLLNTVAYMIAELQNPNQNILDIKQFILCFYIVDLVFHLIAFGFLKSKALALQRLYDISLIIFYQLYLQGRIGVDITPFRLIRLLGSLGAIFPGLNRMLNGLIVALMYMAESIIFTLLTSILFASISVSLFHGFFNNRCDHTEDSWVQCVQGYCEQGACVYNETSADPTSSYNNIIYSFGLVLRTVTMDGYTYTMYYMMRSFHNYVCVLFMIIIFLGGFFNFNLPIAVFKVYFSQHNSDFVNNEQFESKKNFQSFKLNLIRELGLLDQVKQLLYFPYKKAQGDHQLIVPFAIMRINTNSIQNPRILGGMHEVEENTIKSKLKKIQEKLQTINIFQLILPKYQLLSNYYHKNQLDTKLKQILARTRYQNDLLLLFEPPNILALTIDFTTEYKSSSQLVILKNRIYPIIERNRNLRQSLNIRKKLYYKDKSTNKSIFQNMFKQQSRFKCKIPILRVQRLQGIKSMEISKLGNSQSSLSLEINDLKFINSQNDQPRRSLHSSTILIKDAQPFIQYRRQDQEVQVFIHERYLNYNQLSSLINQDVKSLVPQKEQLQFELKYYQILKKEQERKILKTKLWSGKNILLKEQTKIKQIFDSLNHKDINIWLVKFSGFYIISRKYAHQIINKPFGRFFFDICILVNTIAVALQGIISRNIIDQIEDVILFILLFEVLVYTHVYTIKRLSKNIEFIIELLIITTSLMEFIFSEELNLSITSLRALRATKCLLFYRCIRYLQISRVIWVIFKITYQSTIHLIFLMFFTVFIFSLVGIQLYSHQFYSEQESGYLSSFDDPLKGVMTVFDNMTNDDWYTIFSNGSKVNRVYAALFSYTQVLVLNYFVFGIFMAISLDGFSQYLDQEENNLDNQFLANKLRSIRKFNKKLKDQVEQYQPSDDSEQSSLSSNSSSEADLDNQNIPLQIQVQQATQLQQLSIFKRNNIPNPIVKASTKQSQQSEFISQLKAEQSNLRKNINIVNIKQQPSRFLHYLQESIKIIQKDVLKSSNTKPYSRITCTTSFFIFDKQNPFRKYLYKVLNNQLYTYLWLVLLVYQLFLLTNTQEYSNFDSWIEILINTLLLIDKVMKSIVYGFCYDDGSLLNCTIWEMIDLVYIIFYFIYILNISQASLFEVLQILVYFRPILMLYQIQWIKSITVALGQSVYDILNVLLFIVSIWLIFAIFGVIIFSDKFGYCSFSYNYLVDREECVSQNLIWYNYKHNFDNITVALPALFVISTFDGLAEPLWIMQNSQFSQLGPEPYTNQLNTYVYIISFCTIGAFILLNILTGVLFINLKANSKALQDIQFTESQLEFMTVGNLIIRTTYNQSVYKNIYAKRFTDSKLMQQFIYLIVLLNAVSIVIFYREASQDYLNTLNIFHHICTIILILWCLLRYLSKGQKMYLENFWDSLYSLVVIFGTFDLILDLKVSWFYEFTISDQTTQYYHLYRIIHMFRNIRMLGVFEGLPKVSRMVRVMSFSFNYFFQIIFLFFIVMITYAYFGVYFFSHLDKGLVINDLINFRSFWLSLITLFKCATGDDFRSVMNDCMQHNPYCQTDPFYCGSPWAQVYFFSFMIISNNILINLFILGLIERFELFFNNTDSILQTYVEQIDNMKVIWEQYSEGNDFHMNVRYLPHFLVKIGEPLGCKSYENLWDASKLAGSFKLKCDLQNQIAQNQLFYELFRKRYKTNVLNVGNDEVIEKMRIFDKQMKFRLFYYRVSTRHKRNNIGPQLQMKGNTNVLHEMFAALLCFKTWQKYTEELISNIITNKAAEYSRRSIESQDVPILSKHQISVNENDSNAQLPEQPQYQRVQSRNKKKVSIFIQQVEYRQNELLKPVYRVISDFDQIYSINTENPIQQIKNEVSQSKHKQTQID